MSVIKKNSRSMLLSLFTVLVMAVSVLTFAPAVVNAEGEPESEEASFTITGKSETTTGGDEIVAITLSYSTYVSNKADVTVEEYNSATDNWNEVGSKTCYSALNGMVLRSNSSDFSGISFDKWLRVSIKNGANPREYSNVIKVVSSGSESESGSGSEDSGSGSGVGDGGLENSQTTCPHDRGWVSADTNGSLQCKLCGFICDHSKNTNTQKKNEDYKSDDEKGHHLEYTIRCSVCDHKDIEFKDPITPHEFSKASYQSDGKHYKTCSKCGYGTLEKCDYVVKKAEYYTDSSFPDAASKGHNVTYVCTICGDEERETQEKHKLVNGKCTVCGWKKVTPGKIKGVKVKVKSRKTVKKTFRSHGYFDYLGRWVSGKTTNSSFKICKVNISFKKAKNAYQYKIQKTPGSGTTYPDSWITKKTGNKYEMWFKSGTGKVTLKITPYSKEGVKGKTVKKTFRI